VRYYLSFVALGLLMGALCLLLEMHLMSPPALAMIGLFGAQGDVSAVTAAGAGLPA